jgi:hypothetical protein
MKPLTITVNVLSTIAAGLIVWALYPVLLKVAAIANALHYAWP